MSDFTAIEKHIRAAQLQRSVAIGTAVGEALAGAWLGAERLGGKISGALRRPERGTKVVPSH